MKKISKILSLVFVLYSVFALSGCITKTNTTQNKRKTEELVLSDDKYRNYYEIFVYSFYDSNGDGYGDLNGVTQKLDYVKEMGFNGIWLMPINNASSYHGYDVTNYLSIDSKYGTEENFVNLLNAAHSKGINVIMDLVINHTSINHPWFQEAARYIRTNGKPGGTYGNYYNFSKSSLSGYSKLPDTDYYYEAQFWSGMPDLNLDSSTVKNEIVNIMAHWLNLGVDGFRLDAVTSYYTNYTQNNVEFLDWLYKEAKKIKPSVYMVGEAWLNLDTQVRKYYDSGVDSFFLFPSAQASGSTVKALAINRSNNGQLFGNLLKTQETTYDIGIMAPFLSNHDTDRAQTFIGRTTNNKVKMAQGLISLMKGAMFVYYGEEIGMSSPVSNSDPSKRVAILWDTKESEGYCTRSPEGLYVNPDTYYSNGSVKEQVENNDSILNYYKYSTYIRNANPEIARGTTQVFESYYEQSPYVCVFTRTYGGKTITIVVNLSYENEVSITLNQDELGFDKMTHYLCANYEDDVTYSDGTLKLPPYSYAIFR